jgi:FtsP/CotA-like multicopper oxidase with cupredoxin domain
MKQEVLVKSQKLWAEITRLLSKGLLTTSMLVAVSVPVAHAEDSSIFWQCPEETANHPAIPNNVGSTDAEDIFVRQPNDDGSRIKCDHLTAGDGITTMADDKDGTGNGKRMYIFGFNRVAAPGESVSSLSNETVDGVELPTTAPDVASGNYPSWVMEQGTFAANAPAPTIVMNEDDEYFLNLTNTGMIQRPDLFDPHTVHFHGFPNASAIFDGVPDDSIAINMGATLTYYYQPKDAGTYMYHCHVEATEHMQMGMLGNLFVRPRQDRCETLEDLPADDPRHDLPGASCPSGHMAGDKYAYDDGDGTTRYDVEVPVQLGSFDPDFHDASFNTQPLPFAKMRDRYFLLNGRGYPDTTSTATISTVDELGRTQHSQPVDTLIVAAPGQRILLRISNLNVTDIYTVGVNGPAMEVVGRDARLLRDDDGNNMYYKTNSITIGGGQSADVIIDTSGLVSGQKFFFYTKNLDKLANDTENLGGMMTEIQIQASI